MIRLKGLSIENFRSIVGEPITFIFDDYNVIVGPNNCGKSNILRALNLIFNDKVDDAQYDFAIDFPKYSGLSNRSKTAITISIEYGSNDVKLERAIKNLEVDSGQKRLEDKLLRLRLEYSRQNTPQWRFFSKAGLRNIKAEFVLPIVEALRSSVRFKYLPVGRDIHNTIRDELSEELIKTIFSGWSGAVKPRKKINETIGSLLELMQPRLESSGIEISDAIGLVFDEIKNIELRLPFDDLESMLPYLIPTIKDNYETSINQKGAGIQTSTLLFLLKYLADHHPQRHHLRITYIWAIEEPESYLHPAKQRDVANMLEKFSKDVQTFTTTHSGNFVSRSNNSLVYVIDKDLSSPYSTTVIGNEFEDAKQSLGASLLDSMYLYKLNVVVEGPSDEILWRGAWEKLYKNGDVKFDPTEVRFFPGTNAQSAATLYEVLSCNVNDKDVFIKLLLDDDSAGHNALKGLIGRGRLNRQLKSNKDYFLVEGNSEWCTAYKIMMKLSEKYPAKVKVVANTSGEIKDFIICDTAKKKIAKEIIKLSDVSDLADFKQVISKMEKALI